MTEVCHRHKTSTAWYGPPSRFAIMIGPGLFTSNGFPGPSTDRRSNLWEAYPRCHFGILELWNSSAISDCSSPAYFLNLDLISQGNSEYHYLLWPLTAFELTIFIEFTSMLPRKGEFSFFSFFSFFCSFKNFSIFIWIVCKYCM